MTFLFEPDQQAPRIAGRRPPTEGEVSWFEGLGAATTSASIENNANFRAQNVTSEVEVEKLEDIFDRIGEGPLLERLKERGMVSDTMETITPDLLRHNGRARQEMLDMARERASEDTDGWGDLDLSEEGITAEANKRLQSDYQDAQDILSMMGGGRGAAEMLGGMIGITADIRNAPFLLLGGGSGSFVRIAAREALLNAGAEGVFLPSQFDMAERLNIPDPNVPRQLAMAAAAGAVIGGVVEGAARGIAYWRGRGARSQAHSLSSRPEEDMSVELAEDILTSEAPDPFVVLERRAREAPPFVRDTPQPRDMPELADFARTADVSFPSGMAPVRFDTTAAVSSNARYQAARAADPITMQRYEELSARKETYRRWMEEIRAGQAADADQAEAMLEEAIGVAQERLRATQGKGNKAKIRATIREMQADLQDMQKVQRGAETGDTRELRRAIVEVDEQMRDLAPAVGKAFRDGDAAPVPDGAELPGRAPDVAEVDAMMSQFFGDQGEVDVPVVVREGAAPQDRPSSVSPLANPADADADAAIQGIVADTQEEIELNGDFEVIDIDGNTRMASDVLRDMEEDRSFAEQAKICGVRTKA
ncbi:hypothetical protein [Oceanicola sp. S124]|uniref:hypothetical protein n=1 Tax=Oceanicola sp. S124 TaxID=1042378 RepID=UPI000255A966|nr:hypothetical protein [Oceanicola sp. S124]